MSSVPSGLSPGDRAVVRGSAALAGLAEGIVVWVKRIVGDEAEVLTQESEPRTVKVQLSSLSPSSLSAESSGKQSARKNQRPSLLVQILRPVAIFVFFYLVWRSWNRWPRFEEPRALPSPGVQQPALPRDGYVPPPPLPRDRQ